MPWREVSIMSERNEFVVLARGEGANIWELCDRFGISRKTGYKWLQRFEKEGPSGLADRSRRPSHCPWRASDALEAAVLAVRAAHPAWGGRKIAAVLLAQGVEEVPAPSTITRILRRHGCISPEASRAARPLQRFEAAEPNALWQMDFKGHFPLRRGRCHPLTTLDDHSRFAIGLEACRNESRTTVQERLTQFFERYGLPDRVLADNGSPWGGTLRRDYTRLGVWLMRLGVRLSHGRPYHPQTQGKDERFHRTLQAEVLAGRSWKSLSECQEAFDRWREVYNLERPHQALGMVPPATRYQVSPRPMPHALPPIEYGTDDTIRMVDIKGDISVRNQQYRIGKAFHGQPVALRPTTKDGVMEVYFCRQHVKTIDLARPRRCRPART